MAHGLAEGQHFIDGNKRIALVAMRVFLRLNGFDVVGTQETRAYWILSLAAPNATPEHKVASLASHLFRAMRPLTSL